MDPLMTPDEWPLRQELVRVGRLMYEKGLVSASDGNLSARLGTDRILVTPSGLPKGMLEPGQMLVVDLEGRLVGPRRARTSGLRPTSELPMHLEAFRQRPDVRAVIHAHPPIAVALSIAGIPMNECLLPEVIVFLGLVPTTPYATPASEENSRAIRQLIRSHDAIILQRHGSLTVGDSLLQAFMRLETVEQNARIGFMLAQLGVTNPLPPAEVEKLLAQRRQMGLMRPHEPAQFCTVCGVCHDGGEHAPTLRGRLETDAGAPALSAPRTPTEPAGVTPMSAAEMEAIREAVSRVVRQTVGR